MAQIKDELVNALKLHNYVLSDVYWVGSADGKYAMNISDFLNLFGDLTYDEGYGGQEIASDLVVSMGEGAWFERAEYDGAENWEFKCEPIMDSPKSFTRIKADTTGWRTLDELQHESKRTYPFD